MNQLEQLKMNQLVKGRQAKMNQLVKGRQAKMNPLVKANTKLLTQKFKLKVKEHPLVKDLELSCLIKRCMLK